MVRMWYMSHCGENDDPRLPHMTDPPEFTNLEKLVELGLSYYKIDADNFEKCEMLNRVRKERGYDYMDSVTLTDGCENYEQQIRAYFKEHMHEYEEIRLVLDGTGYEDVRDKDDRWIRIEITKGDLIILPPGIYHRFTLDTKDYIKANRYFIGAPVWTSVYRPCDEHPARQQYVKDMNIKVPSAGMIQTQG